jgi:hypothetical protein
MPEVCPCQNGRIGAFLLTLGLNCIWMDHGVWPLPGLMVGVGALMIRSGIKEARSHDDNLNEASAFWSLIIGGLSAYALWHGWSARPFWLSLMASEVFNLWLNFRGPRHQRQPVEEVRWRYPPRR